MCGPHFCSMNTRLSGSARVDSRRLLPSGDVRGPTNFVKITEDVRKYAAEQGIAETEALESGMQEKRKQFQESGAELYAKA
jgi:phosphomethylpyrimidine synthase